MNKSNGKLELDNWIQIGIAYVINQNQSMLEVIQRLLNLERKFLMVSIDQYLPNS